MRAYILHTADGEIRSVVLAEDDTGIPVMPGEGESVTEISAEGVAAELSPLEIHENYRFDVERGELVRRTGGN
jgi:hypothetical protein